MFNLLDSRIDLWLTNLNLSHDVINKFEGYLDKADTGQIKKLKFEYLKKRAIITKGLLRLLIGNYLNLNPAELVFAYNEFGKPFINDNLNELQFNISHSDDMAVFAFSRSGEIGADIEKVKVIDDMQGVMNICFTGYEKDWFNDINAESRVESFYKVWTIKEAFIKAIGRGFSFDPKDVELTNESGNQMLIRKINSNEFAGKKYRVKTIDGIPGYIISLVYEQEKEIRQIKWIPD